MTKYLIVVLLAAMLFPLMTMAAEDAGTRAGYSISGVTQDDLDGDRQLDRTTIWLSAESPGRLLRRIEVHDRNDDMRQSDNWWEATDFENDAWVFFLDDTDAPALIVEFSRTGTTVVAKIFDDVNLDGRVGRNDRYRRDSSMNGDVDWPTITLTSLDGFWRDESVASFNLDMIVDGDAYTGVNSAYASRGQTDGQIDALYQLRDPSRRGYPEYLIVQGYPVRETRTDQKTVVIVNKGTPDAPITDSLFWMHLGEITARDKPYGKSPSPIQVDWSKRRITQIMGWIAGRANDDIWFVGSSVRVVPGETIWANFENPFNMYDIAADDDGIPELTIRLENHPANDILGLRFPTQLVRYSWDQDNNQSWDYSLFLIGRHTINQVVRVGDVSLYSLPWESAPRWVIGQPWDALGFVSVERKEPYWSSEGIYEFQTLPMHELRNQYVSGRSERPPEEQFSRLAPGFRGEYRFAWQDRARVYISPVDRKLHLKGAEAGIWNIDDRTEIRYADRDGDGYLDEWIYTERAGSAEGEDHEGDLPLIERRLNRSGSHLIYSDNTQVIIRQVTVPPSVFESDPPTDHDEWQALGDRLKANQLDVEPGDFLSLLRQFDGPETRIDGATSRDYRAIGNHGFHLTLALSPSARFEGTPVLPIDGLEAGAAYVITRANDGEIAVRPYSPYAMRGTITVAPALNVREQQPIRVTVRNEGTQTLPDGNLVIRAWQGNGAPLTSGTIIGVEPVATLGLDSSTVTVQWAPPEPGVWHIDAAIEIEHREPIPLGSVTVTALPRTPPTGWDVLRASTTAWQLPLAAAGLVGLMLTAGLVAGASSRRSAGE